MLLLALGSTVFSSGVGDSMLGTRPMYHCLLTSRTPPPLEPVIECAKIRHGVRYFEHY